MMAAAQHAFVFIADSLMSDELAFYIFAARGEWLELDATYCCYASDFERARRAKTR